MREFSTADFYALQMHMKSCPLWFIKLANLSVVELMELK